MSEYKTNSQIYLYTTFMVTTLFIDFKSFEKLLSIVFIDTVSKVNQLNDHKIPIL